MPVKTAIPFKEGTFFITFTCYKWLPLIDKVNGYNIIYNWFDYLKSKGHFLNGYVIMPNHIHALISFADTNKSINTIIGNGKRFMAYEIVKELKQKRDFGLLEQLSNEVEAKRKEENKLHNVWELSFDWKECRSKGFIEKKLDYIHANPCTKKWQLCNNPIEYKHSSAKFYIEGQQGIYDVTSYMELDEVSLVSK